MYVVDPTAATARHTAWAILQPPQPWRRRCAHDDMRLGIQILAAKAEDKEQLFDAKGFASAARDSLLDVRGVAGPLARGEGL